MRAAKEAHLASFQQQIRAAVTLMQDGEAFLLPAFDRAAKGDGLVLRRGSEKARGSLGNRKSDDAVTLEQRALVREQAREQRPSRFVEPFEVVRIEHNPGGVAVAPLYRHHVLRTHCLLPGTRIKRNQ